MEFPVLPAVAFAGPDQVISFLALPSTACRLDIPVWSLKRVTVNILVDVFVFTPMKISLESVFNSMVIQRYEHLLRPYKYVTFQVVFQKNSSYLSVPLNGTSPWKQVKRFLYLLN